MTRDNALKIAKRILDRIEQDRAVHLDAVADEIVAGMVLVTPPLNLTPASQRLLDDDKKRQELLTEEGRRAWDQLKLQQEMMSHDHGIWRVSKTSYGTITETFPKTSGLYSVGDTVFVTGLDQAGPEKEPPPTSEGISFSGEYCVNMGWTVPQMRDAGYVHRKVSDGLVWEPKPDGIKSFAQSVREESARLVQQSYAALGQKMSLQEAIRHCEQQEKLYSQAMAYATDAEKWR